MHGVHMNTYSMSARDAVGRAIRGAMAERRVSQMELAKRSGMSRSGLGKKLTGQTTITTSDLDTIADALGVSMADIVASAERIRETAVSA